MNLGEPWWLWQLAGVVAFALILLLFAWSGRAGGAAVRWPRIARVVASRAGVRAVHAGRTVRRPWLLLLALAGVVLALARPRWGQVDEPMIEQSREVMVALDLSRSMLVGDVPPSRLERAKLLMQSLLDGLHGERVGLIVFAGTAFVQMPLSSDYQILHEFLPELKPDYMPQGGTDYAGMVRAALGGFGTDTQTDRYLIVLSDGESHTDGWRNDIPELRKRNVRAIALGVGTPNGGFIPDPKGGYLKDERGAVVLSKLEPGTLQALASETHGVFRNASDWIDLAAVLQSTVEQGQRGRSVERHNVRYLERFQWVLAPAVLLALLGLWREVAVRPRQQTIRRATTGEAAAKSATASAGLAAALVLAFTLPPALRAAEPKKEDGPDARVRETIARLAASPAPTARDWRELADRTLVYGTGARMSQQPVEPGAVRDALTAVDLGQKAEPSLTDWKKLRADLTALLETPPEQKPPEKKPPEEQKKDDQQKQDEKQDQQKQDQQKSPENQNSPPDKPQDQQQKSPPDKPDQKPGQPKPEDGAMGEMKQEPPPKEVPPESSAPPPKTRKIGAKPANENPPPADAETAVLQQRMRQAAEKDSPARLFQLLEGDDKQPPERGKDW